MDVLFNALENKLSDIEKSNITISTQNVGWHIHHSLLVIQSICKTVIASNENEYKWSFNIKRTIVILLNKIPRGKGKAPTRVVPTQIANSATLREQLNSAKELYQKMLNCKPNQYFSHPYFGMLNLKTTLLFLQIHTKHHLKIIDDIVNK